MKKCVEKAAVRICRETKRRESRYKGIYVVYGYKASGEFTPNMICLAKAYEDAHVAFITEQLASAAKSDKGFVCPADLELVRIGEFQTLGGKFKSLSHCVVTDFKSVKEIKK